MDVQLQAGKQGASAAAHGPPILMSAIFSYASSFLLLKNGNALIRNVFFFSPQKLLLLNLGSSTSRS